MMPPHHTSLAPSPMVSVLPSTILIASFLLFSMQLLLIPTLVFLSSTPHPLLRPCPMLFLCMFHCPVGLILLTSNSMVILFPLPLLFLIPTPPACLLIHWIAASIPPLTLVLLVALPCPFLAHLLLSISEMLFWPISPFCIVLFCQLMVCFEVQALLALPIVLSINFSHNKLMRMTMMMPTQVLTPACPLLCLNSPVLCGALPLIPPGS